MRSGKWVWWRNNSTLRQLRTTSCDSVACTSLPDVQVIRRLPGGALRLETGGGWRRTCAWRERRWPNFIIWRWAGPAQGGWTPCPRKEPLLHLPRRRRRRSISMSPRPNGGRARAARGGAGPGRSHLLARPSGAARSPPGKVLGKAPRRVRAGRPSEPAAGRPNGAAARAPAERAQPARAGPAPPHGAGQRRAEAAGGVSPAATGPRRN
jgi:hypothetical protein